MDELVQFKRNKTFILEDMLAPITYVPGRQREPIRLEMAVITYG